MNLITTKRKYLKKTLIFLRYSCILLLTLLLIEVLFFNSQGVFFYVAEKALSSDGTIGHSKWLYIKYFLGIFNLITISLILDRVTSDFSTISKSITPIVRKFYIFLICYALFFLIVKESNSQFYFEFYAENSVFETLTFILTFISSIILLSAGLIAIRKDRKKAWILFLPAALFFLYSMEEISWGQQLFHWSTPESIRQYNVQSETNLHNLFFDQSSILPIFVTILYSIFCIPFIKIKQSLPDYYQIILPSLKYVIMALFFNVLAIVLQFDINYDELIEETLAFWSILYSFDVYRMVKERVQNLNRRSIL